jgi:hypothetical protein
MRTPSHERQERDQYQGEYDEGYPLTPEGMFLEFDGFLLVFECIFVVLYVLLLQISDLFQQFDNLFFCHQLFSEVILLLVNKPAVLSRCRQRRILRQQHRLEDLVRHFLYRAGRVRQE